ncbi:hypothetical protein V500_09752 [Pseudogymnoascus sp. VKM F-4518 (FW-2643)]|nr:hypothetical protein V500_09752 [Pseudogymnoascus sp. VKM F-4518 (FW-2643)]
MAKSAPPKKKSITSVRSRAAKRASSPSIDTDKSLKDAKPPSEEKTPAVLGIHHGAGITKKSKHGRKAVLSARAKRRQEISMDRAEAAMDKKSTKIEKSKDRARTIQSRSKTWDEQNRRMLARKELEAAIAVEREQGGDWVDESGDDEVEEATITAPIDTGDVQMDLAAAPLASAAVDAVAAEEDDSPPSPRAQPLTDMVQYIITPWRDRDELIKVRQAFYQKPSNGGPPDKEAWQNAVALVSVWAQRGNCPHLIESTALLISASVNDRPGSSAYAVRAAYSAAFCRFVTGLLDGYQDKKHKLSMFSIAKNIGLPATFVELRHQCTHEELPSLGKLRGACERSLDWIWRQYWSSLEGKDKSSGSDEDPEGVDDLSMVLQEYMLWNEGTESSDEGQRLSFVRRLKKWDTDQILDTLEEFREPGAADSGMMLKSIRLTRGILNGTADQDAFGPVEEGDTGAGSGQGDATRKDSNAVEPTSSGLGDAEEENLGWKLQPRCLDASLRCEGLTMPAKRRAPSGGAEPSAPKPRQSKLAKEHNISGHEENEIKEAFSLFSIPHKGEKEGVIPTQDVKKAMIALGVQPTKPELAEFLEILDPDSEGYAPYSSFVAICALKMRAKDNDTSAKDEEVEQGYLLFTNGTDGPITMAHLKRTAAMLKEDVSEELLKDMILEANGGSGLSKGVGKEEFAEVMKRAGVWR